MKIIDSIIRLAKQRTNNNDEGSLWDSLKQEERRIVLTILQAPEQYASVAYANVSQYVKKRFGKLAEESL